MSSFFNLELSREEKRFLFQELCFESSDPKSSKECRLWLKKSRTDDGYCVRTFTFRNVEYKKVRVHRLLYFIFTGDHALTNPAMHISHKCHQKTCLQFDHLSLEPASVNNSRQICKYDGCGGHAPYDDCIQV